MLEAGKITEEQYNEARDFDVIASLTDKKNHFSQITLI